MRDMRVVASAVLPCLVAVATAQVQDDDARYRETYAIVNAKIEVGDGRVIEKGTVLVRNGRIAAVGSSVTVPGFARVIKGEGLTVYPGFIDAFSIKGVKLPEWNPDQDQRPDYGVNAAISMRVANRKGVRPELNVADYLDLGGSLQFDERKAGFTTALIAPSGGILNGSATLVNLDGRPAREAILVPTFGSAVGFSAPGQGYPGTPLGVMAHLRQTFYDAQRARAAAASGDLPRADRPLEALQAVLRGETPVLVDADRSYEITRALSLSEQFNLKPILVGGGEAFMRVDEIKRRGIPVILGIHFQAEPKPEKKEEPRKPGQKPAEPSKDEPKKDEPKKDDPTETPPEVLAERQAKWIERVKTAQVLASNGIPFAFSSRGPRSRADFWKNLRRTIAEGLPREAAMRALTINPARMFGVERELGTVEVGKRANLTVMSGDFAKEGTKVRYMIIGDRFFEPETDKPRSAGPPSRGPFDDDAHEGSGCCEEVRP